MNINIFSANFWALGFWQGLGVLVSVVGLFVSPLLSMWVERLFGKKENQEEVNAYKAILLPDSSLTFGGLLMLLCGQVAASYCLFIVFKRVFVFKQYDSNVLLTLSATVIFLPTWILCGLRRKSLAKLLTWHVCLVMFLFCLLLVSSHLGGNTYITHDFSMVKDQIRQYLPAELKQIPFVANLRNVPLNAIPIDIRIPSPGAAKIQLIQMYFLTLALLLFFYTLHKRHRANRITAFVHLSEKQRREELDKVEYQDKLMTLEIKTLTKQEKEADLTLKKEQNTLVLDRDRLALEKDRLEVESARLDVEKKRAEYTLELAVRVIDTLYTSGGSPEERSEALRLTLPAFKDFGHSEANSATVIFQVLQEAQERPKAIPVTIV